MYVIEVFFGEWATLIRCVYLRANQSEFMQLEESLAVLAHHRNRMSWPLRLTRWGEPV